MKKMLIMLSAVALVGSSLTSCKKGENDPFLSLKSRKGRITGNWNMTNVQRTVTDVDAQGDGERRTTTYSNNNRVVVTEFLDNNSVVATETREYDYYLTFEVVKDGTFVWTETATENKYNGTAIPAAGQTTVVSIINGNWMFSHKNKDADLKNKEAVVMTTKSLSVNGTGFVPSNYSEAYTGIAPDGTVILLDQLKNKEMIALTEWSVTDGDGNDYSVKEVVTYEKE